MQRGSVRDDHSRAPGQVFARFRDDFQRSVRKCQSMSCFRPFFPRAGPDFPAVCARRLGPPDIATKDQPQRHRDTEKTQRKALVMLTAKRVSGTNLRFLCAFSVPLCLSGSNSSSWYDLPTTGPTTITLTALLTHLLTHAPSNL